MSNTVYLAILAVIVLLAFFLSANIIFRNNKE